jgi:hypothetical protein
MATEPVNDPEKYIRVSSLYGPGTIGCWYLIILSCFVSWLLNPKKRRSGSVDSNYIAVLTLPTVAAGHLVSQIRDYPGSKREMMVTTDPILRRLIASIEASLNVTETFMAFSVVLVLVAVWFKCFKRAFFAALVGLFCFASEGYVFFSAGIREGNKGNFSRLFLINFKWLLAAVFALLVACFVSSIGLLGTFYLWPPVTRLDQETTTMHRARSQISVTPIPAYGDPRMVVLHRQAIVDSEQLRLITLVTLFYLPFGMMTTMGVNLIPAFQAARDLVLSDAVKVFAAHIFENVFPRSSASLKDLDQVVALLGGVVVLGFSIYSAADVCYQKWRKAAQVPQENIALENIALERRDD